MGSVFAPISAVFGLPGEAAAVLIGADVDGWCSWCSYYTV